MYIYRVKAFSFVFMILSHTSLLSKTIISTSYQRQKAPKKSPPSPPHPPCSRCNHFPVVNYEIKLIQPLCKIHIWRNTHLQQRKTRKWRIHFSNAKPFPPLPPTCSFIVTSISSTHIESNHKQEERSINYSPSSNYIGTVHRRTIGGL